ncbi:ferredoxin-type protein NapF [Edwardsiella ictaluri]|uniref:Ferredoxin-type protein NapF n=1 Tax=Edwardsiella ictaluri (strain 93-146) TaxID=634503 RepID=C5B7B7_EDWI9|nr:ferredoxin-type protein NapF [Edwardsiella ictaluri]ACR68423.1 ferredoxin-type protein NapF, putative [Edwardsiella ictaluri 93-146]EKS7763240.1 ferredoxin-type protein NapF [Edwardsiella ictaluri]EKS7770058.1 ferredoxin-type protein NapF [Edwardsiella ictaluri]EKS7773199.1 ferredoxin-type protein NapF [Edwardsiella ictaluri]EKS7776752.1 ferredoxin-type protein NapF [Edwardsiella ictaluri]
MTTLSRRHLLRGRWHHAATQVRPPWSVNESAFVIGCSRCHACISQCESGVLVVGQGHFPTLDFSRAECTFCRRCADACPEALFLDAAEAPWHLQAETDTHCLTRRGIECRSCQDSCEPRAITFVPQLGGIAAIHLASESCNGCGACVAACPVNAIQIVDRGEPIEVIEVKDA